MASIQVDLSPAVLGQLRTDLLQCVEQSKASGVILDISGLEVMDAEEFSELRRTMQMASVMGAHPILCGLNYGVVSALVDLGVSIDDIDVVRSLDDAFMLLGTINEEQ